MELTPQLLSEERLAALRQGYTTEHHYLLEGTAPDVVLELLAHIEGLEMLLSAIRKLTQVSE